MHNHNQIQAALSTLSKFSLTVSLLILIILTGQKVYAQHLSVEDIEINRLKKLAPQKIRNLQWRPGHDDLIFSNDSAIIGTGLSGGDSILMTREELNGLLRQKGLDTLKRIPSIRLRSANTFSFLQGNSMLLVDMHAREAWKLFGWPEKAAFVTPSPDLKYCAYALGPDIFLLDQDNKTINLSEETEQDFVNGREVYRNEFGMTTGIYWSPDGKHLAWYRKDEHRVSNYPLVDISQRVATLVPDKYPMAGMESEQTWVRIYHLERKKTITLDFSAVQAAYHTNPSWSADGKHIFFQHLNRGQDTLRVRQYDVASGKYLDECFTETDEQYVEPLNPLFFLKDGSNNFLYQSARSGFNHIYRYSRSEDKLEPMTSGNWEVTELIGADTRGNIYFMATGESPLERHLYRRDRESGEIELLTAVPGVHRVQMNEAYTAFTDCYDSRTIPYACEIRNAEGELMRHLLRSDDPFKEFTMGQSEYGTLKAADEATDLHYHMILPPGFDSTQSYPVVLYVYGGPHVQLIRNQWKGRIDLLGHYLAQRGVVFLQVDPRGSSGRGAGFEQVIHRQTGIPQMEDYLATINWLNEKPWIDSSRMGITGWSFGGYMTIMMMTWHPEIFHAGVAGGPVVDWSLYEVMYGERYMDTPRENPEGYKNTNLTHYVGALSSDLLIIQGYLDDVVVPQHCLSFVEACIKQGTYVDLFIYPMHEHNVSGTDRIHLTQMITDYLLERLENQ